MAPHVLKATQVARLHTSEQPKGLSVLMDYMLASRERRPGGRPGERRRTGKALQPRHPKGKHTSKPHNQQAHKHITQSTTTQSKARIFSSSGSSSPDLPEITARNFHHRARWTARQQHVRTTRTDGPHLRQRRQRFGDVCERMQYDL